MLRRAFFRAALALPFALAGGAVAGQPAAVEHA
jgi:hypothetical protein